MKIIGKKNVCKKHREPFCITKRQKFECVSCMLDEIKTPPAKETKNNAKNSVLQNN